MRQLNYVQGRRIKSYFLPEMLQLKWWGVFIVLIKDSFLVAPTNLKHVVTGASPSATAAVHEEGALCKQQWLLELCHTARPFPSWCVHSLCKIWYFAAGREPEALLPWSLSPLFLVWTLHVYLLTHGHLIFWICRATTYISAVQIYIFIYIYSI